MEAVKTLCAGVVGWSITISIQMVLRKVQMLRFLNHIRRRRQSLPNCTSEQTTILHRDFLSSFTNLLFLESTVVKAPLELTLCNSVRLHGCMGTFSSSQIAGPISKLPYRRRGTTTTRITNISGFAIPILGIAYAPLESSSSMSRLQMAEVGAKSDEY